MDMNFPLETKVARADVVTDDILDAFEAFKDANDQRLAQIEKRMSADVITSEKVDRISKAIDELSLKARRPALAAEKRAEPSEHKQAFESYVRKGETMNLSAIEQKAMSIGSNPDGGYIVPQEMEIEIGRVISKASPMRSICDVRQTSTTLYKKPFVTTGAIAGWVGEVAARPQTNSPVIAEMQYPAMELYAMPSATQALLDDAVVNLDEWIAREIETVFAEQETQAFTVGDGTNKPKGFMDYPKVANASWSWSNTGYIATGVAGAFAATNPTDKLVDLIYALKAGYRQNGRWILNRATQSAIRKFKDGQGNYLWQPAAVPGGEAMLLNFPVTESEYMVDIATDAHAVAFGDFKRGYLIVDRVGTRILRDPYSNKPYVMFYVTKRVGGGIQDFDAIKTLKFGVS
jgi:HK97 family phage major capsid protein